MRFRKLLNEHKLGEALFARVGQELMARGIKVHTGTIVDATIIGAPSSTKNADKARDPGGLIELDRSQEKFVRGQTTPKK